MVNDEHSTGGEENRVKDGASVGENERTYAHAVGHQPHSQPPSDSAESVHLSRSVNTPGVVILQWLTYAFWGWTLIALYWLTGLSVQYFIQKSSLGYDTSSSNFLAYPMAAVIVLFIISIICDVVYSRFEPRHKTGAAMVIMVIHAVIFALCGIGSLIVAVFAVVNMLISGGSEGVTTVLITALVLTLLYAITLLRTLRPVKITHVRKAFWVTMLIATLIISSLGIFGPIAYAQRTKNDRLIQAGLPRIASAINEYTQNHEKLPNSLKETELKQYYSYKSEDVEQIIKQDLVSYYPKKQLNKQDFAQLQMPGARSVVSEDEGGGDAPIFHYQLCVTYKEKNDRYDGYDTYGRGDGKYPTYPAVNRHPAGKVCYDLQTEDIY